MKQILVILNMVLAPNAFAAGEVCEGGSSLVSQVRLIQSVSSEDPKCISKESVTKEGGTPESQMRVLMEGLSDREVFARMIIAESRASGCASLDVARSIGWVLKNRVDANSESRFGTGVGVIFKEYQFRSSTGSCDVAQRELFLCPASGGPAWREEWQSALRAYDESMGENAENPLPGVTNYFFYKHFDNSKDCSKWKGVLPAWATEDTRVTPSGITPDSTCVGFYR